MPHCVSQVFCGSESTNLQYSSCPFSPQVAFTLATALGAIFDSGGNAPPPSMLSATRDKSRKAENKQKKSFLWLINGPQDDDSVKIKKMQKHNEDG